MALRRQRSDSRRLLYCSRKDTSLVMVNEASMVGNMLYVPQFELLEKTNHSASCSTMTNICHFFYFFFFLFFISYIHNSFLSFI